MTDHDNHKKEDNIMTFPIEKEEYQNSRTIQQIEEPQEFDKLFEALAKAQLEMEIAKTDSVNTFYKNSYADLSSIIRASRPFLAKNGLSVIQRILTKEVGEVFLYTRLCHSSGQWIESNMEVKPPKSDVQTLGSYLTYLRRYMYSSITGVVAGDEDDDGEIATQENRKDSPNSPQNTTISKAQLQVISNEISEFPVLLEGILKGYKIKKVSDLKTKDYTKCIETIRQIKRAQEK